MAAKSKVYDQVNSYNLSKGTSTPLRIASVQLQNNQTNGFRDIGRANRHTADYTTYPTSLAGDINQVYIFIHTEA